MWLLAEYAAWATGVACLVVWAGFYFILVTCYPFYFVGPAPQRFIVRAVVDNRASTSAQP